MEGRKVEQAKSRVESGNSPQEPSWARPESKAEWPDKETMERFRKYKRQGLFDIPKIDPGKAW